jgi:hypothetical protein
MKQDKYYNIYHYLTEKGFETSLIRFQFPRFTINLYKEIDGILRKVQHISFVSAHKSVEDFETFIKDNV